MWYHRCSVVSTRASLRCCSTRATATMAVMYPAGHMCGPNKPPGRTFQRRLPRRRISDPPAQCDKEARHVVTACLSRTVQEGRDFARLKPFLAIRPCLPAAWWIRLLALSLSPGACSRYPQTQVSSARGHGARHTERRPRAKHQICLARSFPAAVAQEVLARFEIGRRDRRPFPGAHHRRGRLQKQSALASLSLHHHLASRPPPRQPHPSHSFLQVASAAPTLFYQPRQAPPVAHSPP